MLTFTACHYFYFFFERFLIVSFLSQSDIDECSADSSLCDENADCTNNEGSYSCTCKQGFTGNGTVCAGIHDVIQC